MRCIFCGERYEQGYANKLPGNFMSHQWLQAGNGICERCYKFLKAPEARRNSWLIEGPEMRLELLQPLNNPLLTLLEPPEPPFRLYLTKQKRKHGWIRLLKNPALNREHFPIAFEEDIIWVDRAQAQGFSETVKSLREKGITKGALVRGLTAGEAQKIGLSPAEIREAHQNRGNPLWELVVRFER